MCVCVCVCVSVCVHVSVCVYMHVCWCVCMRVVGVTVMCPALPPCAVDGRYRNPLYYYSRANTLLVNQSMSVTQRDSLCWTESQNSSQLTKAKWESEYSIWFSSDRLDKSRIPFFFKASDLPNFFLK